MWFKNLSIYRLPKDWNVNAHDLEQQFNSQRFQASNSLDMQTMGWVSPNDTDALVYGANRQYLVALRVEKRLLPSTVINQAAKAKALELEEQQGFRPGRKQLREIKDAMRDQLLPKAFSIHRDTFVWIDSANGWLVIDSASGSKCDEVIELLSKSLDALPVKPLHLNDAPSTAMTNWLLSDEAPAGLSIDQDTELRATGESRATVRYVRHSIEADEVKKHIESGKQCTRLALTWNDKVSFVLTESMALKKITPLDVLQEKNEIFGNDDERFSSDFSLMTGELSQLIQHMVDVLGGEHTEL